MVVAVGNGLRRGDFFSKRLAGGLAGGLAETFPAGVVGLAADLAGRLLAGDCPPGLADFGAETGLAAVFPRVLAADFAGFIAFANCTKDVAALRFPLMTPSPSSLFWRES